MEIIPNYDNPIPTYERLRETYNELMQISSRAKYLILQDTYNAIVDLAKKNHIKIDDIEHDVEFNKNFDEELHNGDIEAWLWVNLDALVPNGKCEMQFILPSIDLPSGDNYLITIDIETPYASRYAQEMRRLTEIHENFVVETPKGNKVSVVCATEEKGTETFVAAFFAVMAHIVNLEESFLVS